MKKITDYLEELGLSEIEAVLYQGLLETGPTTVMELSEHTSIKRITTHFNINNLIEKGLVAQTIHGARRQIIAEPPERLEYLIEKKVEQVNRLKNKFNDVLQVIQQNSSDSKSLEDVVIKYYEGKKGVQSIYEEMVKASEVHSFINLDKYYDVFPNTENMFWDAFNNNPKRRVWDIAMDSPLARRIAKGHKHYYCKLIKNSKFFSGFDILIYNNKVAINQLEVDNTIGLIISSQFLFLSMRSLHQAMWKLIS